MNTQPTTSSFIVRAAVLLLTVLTTTGAWAQSSTTVSTEDLLNKAITDGATNIQLTEDIKLNKFLNINGITVTIDLNGHRLYRELDSSSDDGHIFWVHNNGNLTLADNSSTHSGSIEGGNATNGGGINVWPGCSLTVSYVTFKNNSASDNGGAIFVRNDATATISNATFIGNSAADHAGAIWNNGTFTATDCTFTGNSSSDVGGIYNSVTTDGAGNATLTGCTFTENQGTTGAGALANAMGNTEMTIVGCTITGNTAGSNGGGIWNGGTLKMQGTVTVTDNHRNDGVVSNVYLKDEKVITLAGALTEGSSIGVELENNTGTFTSGYKDFHYYTAPNTFFTADLSVALSVVFDSNREAYLTIINNNDEYYVERSWDSTHEKVASTYKFLKGIIGYDATPVEGQYKEVTNAPESSPNEWFGMGGYSDNVAEFYVVEGNVQRETIVVQGKDVHLVLADNATLTLTGGLKLEGDNKLYIHSQSYGDNMGRLIVTNKYEKAAGIGSARDDGADKTVGELVIYGGHIEAIGGEYGAGIGSCSESGNKQLCNKVTVYGGHIEATGGEHAAGIGGGARAHGGDFILYDGTVIAIGGGGTIKIVKGNWAAALLGSYLNAGGGAGVGGGGITNPKFDPYAGYGGNVTIYGGTLTATGQSAGAGIGSGGSFFGDSHQNQRCGGTFTMYGGTVTAAGGGSEAGAAAGIGGGYQNGGGTVYVSGGTVTATGGQGAAGIGGGYSAMGSEVTITGGTVIATTSVKEHYSNRAIGPGQGSDNFGTLSIGDAMMVGAGNSGSVERIYDADERKNACWFRSYAEISPCTHPSGITFTINDSDTHTSHCKHCSVSETAEHFNSDGSGTCVCG
ncbi:MAG: hypothetical protein IKZ61_07150, partial [Prevotella sp.]|nr:hypothetical protein [Prevotella sp.]